MPTFYSEQVTKLDAVPAEILAMDESHGKVRMAVFEYDQVAEGADGSIIQLVKLPAGRVRVLAKESLLYHNLTTATVDLDVGWAAYTDFAGDAVAANDDGFDVEIDCETAGIVRLGSALNAEACMKVFESQEGVIITATLETAVIAANDTLNGYIAYILD